MTGTQKELIWLKVALTTDDCEGWHMPLLNGACK
jgi:hypothetical protein